MSNNSTLELETLNKQYAFVLKQYNKATKDYMRSLQHPSAVWEKPTLDCPDNVYYINATSNNYSNISASESNCQKKCAQDYNCTMYLMSDSSNCHLYDNVSDQTYNCAGGSAQYWGQIKSGTTVSDTSEKLLKLVSKLNDKLMQLAEQITSMNNTLEPDLKQSFKQSLYNDVKLQKDLKELNIDKKEISQLLKSINDLNAGRSEGDIIVTSTYYGYIMFIIITMLCILGVIMLGRLINPSNTQKGGRGYKYNTK